MNKKTKRRVYSGDYKIGYHYGYQKGWRDAMKRVMSEAINLGLATKSDFRNAPKKNQP